MIDLVTACVIVNVCLATGGFFLGRASRKKSEVFDSIRAWEVRKGRVPVKILESHAPGCCSLSLGEEGIVIIDGIEYIPAPNSSLFIHHLKVIREGH